jgi:hypothetical protein
MLIEDTITERSCMADYFSKFFDAMTVKHTLKPIGKRTYHRSSTMSKTEVMLILFLSHDLGYRALSISILKRCVSIFGISSQMLYLIIV